MIALRKRRLARIIGTRLAVGACVALTLAVTTGAPSGQLAGGDPSRAGSHIRLVESNELPEIDIMAPYDGSASVPFDFITYRADPQIATVVISHNPAPQATCDFNTVYGGNLAAMVSGHEGRNIHVYLDSHKHPTVGVGFNLDRADAPSALAGVGADYNAVRAGTANLTQAQIDTLFAADLSAATVRAQHFFPSSTRCPPAGRRPWSTWPSTWPTS